MNEHHRIQSVRVCEPSTLELVFGDGLAVRLELAALIAAHRALQPLADAAVFARARVGEWGACVAWDEEENLALAADNLRALAFEQQGAASAESVIAWQTRHGLTLDAAADALGVSRRSLAYWRSGQRPVPRTVALAMRGWEALQAGLAA